jgi:hypothetical protein
MQVILHLSGRGLLLLIGILWAAVMIYMCCAQAKNYRVDDAEYDPLEK